METKWYTLDQTPPRKLNGSDAASLGIRSPLRRWLMLISGGFLPLSFIWFGAGTMWKTSFRKSL